MLLNFHWLLQKAHCVRNITTNMSSIQKEVYSGSVAQLIADTLIKDPKVVQDSVASMHPAAAEAVKDKQCQALMSNWLSCAQKNPEDREPCKMDAAKWLDCAFSTYPFDQNTCAQHYLTSCTLQIWCRKGLDTHNVFLNTHYPTKLNHLHTFIT